MIFRSSNWPYDYLIVAVCVGVVCVQLKAAYGGKVDEKKKLLSFFGPLYNKLLFDLSYLQGGNTL